MVPLVASADWNQLNLTRGVTPYSEEVYQLHMLILWVCVITGIGVFGVIFYSIIKFRKSKGAVAAQWFSDFLGRPLRLVRFDPEHRRLSSMKWTGGVEALNQFSDGFPILVASQASLDGLNQRLQAAGHAPVGMAQAAGCVPGGGHFYLVPTSVRYI
jgi:hypothetical protein